MAHFLRMNLVELESMKFCMVGVAGHWGRIVVEGITKLQHLVFFLLPRHRWRGREKALAVTGNPIKVL